MWKSAILDLGPDRSVHVVQRGSGEDVLLLHGAMTTHHDWLAGPAGALSDDARVTVPDRPGHGLSRRPRFVGTPRDQAGQIADALDRLGVGTSVLVGHSFGALVALALAEGFPDRFTRIVLVSPLIFPEPRLLEHGLIAPRSMPVIGPLISRLGRRSGFDRSAIEWIQAAMFAPAPVPAEWKKSFPYELVLDPDLMVHEGEDAASILPLSPAGTIDLGRIDQPVHVLTGTEDRVVEQERQGKALTRLLRNSRLTEVEGAGHMLHHTHPHLIVGAVRETGLPVPA
jgi:pimeloyl-ACP methyl ester carboxylesterase